MAAEIAPEEGAKMKAVYVNEWCAVGTVADSISFGQLPVPAAPKKAEVLLSIKASSISGDDVGLLQVICKAAGSAVVSLMSPLPATRMSEQNHRHLTHYH